MIETFRAQNYGCLKDVELKLTPIHALIGPNDSGKSTLLRAVETVIRFARAEGGGLPDGLMLSLSTSEGPSYELNVSHRGGSTERWRSARLDEWSGQSLGNSRLPLFPNVLRRARVLRLDPDDLRTPSGLIPEGKALTLTERGLGLPAVYDAILSRGDEAFHDIAREVRRLFPVVKNLRLKATSEVKKTFEVELTDGTKVGANQLSEGLLYFLAFAALKYLDPVSILLVEEPENGLHPARIAEVMKVLRGIAESGTQVVIATHSPLVVNELKPEEVSVVTRTAEQGTKVTPIRETPHFAERSKVYALGELWLSYANGTNEAPLLEGTAK